jgi:hypothetical protein
VINHSFQFARLYRAKLDALQMCIALGSNLLLCVPTFVTSPKGFRRRKGSGPRTFISSTELLDHLYKPAFPVASRFEGYFQPTMVTNANGQLHGDVAELIACSTGSRLCQQNFRRAATDGRVYMQWFSGRASNTSGITFNL